MRSLSARHALKRPHSALVCGRPAAVDNHGARLHELVQPREPPPEGLGAGRGGALRERGESPAQHRRPSDLRVACALRLADGWSSDSAASATHESRFAQRSTWQRSTTSAHRAFRLPAERGGLGSLAITDARRLRAASCRLVLPLFGTMREGSLLWQRPLSSALNDAGRSASTQHRALPAGAWHLVGRPGRRCHCP